MDGGTIESRIAFGLKVAVSFPVYILTAPGN